MSRTSNLATVVAITLSLVGCEAQPGAGAAATDEIAGVGIAREAAMSAGTQNVKVVNAAGDWVAPVPTVAQGTTNVAGTVGATQSGSWSVDISGTPNVNATLTGTPGVNAIQSGSWLVEVMGDVSLAAGSSVQAAQSGPWNVGITGTPTVALAAGAQVAVTGSVSLAGSPTVHVGNDASSPAVVRSTDEASRQPFHFTTGAFFGFGVSIQNSGPLYTVPAGKRLVIDHVSGSVVLATGQFPETKLWTLDANDSLLRQDEFHLTRSGARDANFDSWAFTAPVRLYASAGEKLSLITTRSYGTGPADLPIVGQLSSQLFISGYLIDVP